MLLSKIRENVSTLLIDLRRSGVQYIVIRDGFALCYPPVAGKEVIADRLFGMQFSVEPVKDIPDMVIYSDGNKSFSRLYRWGNKEGIIEW